MSPSHGMVALADPRGAVVLDSSVLYPDLSGGLPILVVQHALCRMVVALQGAHVLSFVPTGRGDLLWISPKSRMAAGQPIRGGIPLCTPWFGPRSGLPLHGFARISPWQIDSVTATDSGATRVVLSLADSASSRAMWPHAFSMQLELIAGTTLQLTFSASHPSDVAVPFEFAYHTYFNVGDVRRASVEGLAECSYVDRLDRGVVKTEGGIVRFDGPIERLYRNVARTQLVRSPAGSHRIDSDSRCALVWNAGDNDRNIPDLGEGNHRGYACVERGDLGDQYSIARGDTYRCSMVLSAL